MYKYFVIPVLTLAVVTFIYIVFILDTTPERVLTVYTPTDILFVDTKSYEINSESGEISEKHKNFNDLRKAVAGYTIEKANVMGTFEEWRRCVAAGDGTDIQNQACDKLYGRYNYLTQKLLEEEE